MKHLRESLLDTTKWETQMPCPTRDSDHGSVLKNLSTWPVTSFAASLGRHVPLFLPLLHRNDRVYEREFVEQGISFSLQVTDIAYMCYIVLPDQECDAMNARDAQVTNGILYTIYISEFPNTNVCSSTQAWQDGTAAIYKQGRKCR